MPARSAALPAATASPAPLDLKRRLLLRVTLFAMMLFLAASAVVVGLAVQRIPAEIHRTGDTIRQLIADEVARRTTAFEQHLVQIDLVGLTGVGALVHFCATLENLYSQPIAQHCFGESHRAGIGLHQGGSEVDSGPRPQRWLAQGLRYLTHDHAVYRAAVGTYPGVKIAELTLTPHYASEAALVGQQLLGLLVITFGVLLINVLVYLPVREALAPAAQILRALRRMQAGDLAVRMPRVRLQELDQIAQGFNHLAERLDATLQARKDLARRLMQVREEERRHLARELHDELGQSLASLRAEAAFVGAAAGGDQPELSVSAQAIDHTTGRMMETLHGILGRLRPTGLEEFGLSASLEHLIDNGRRRSHGQCHCTLQIEGEPDRLSDDHAVSLYRIVQEGLTNAAKHGRPTRIDVRLIHDPATGAVDLSIEDDGRVEPPLPEPAATPRHGLLGMHERVLALDGTLDIGARVPHGVRVQVHLPGHAPPDGRHAGAPSAPLWP